jgi:hypothetical protein
MRKSACWTVAFAVIVNSEKGKGNGIHAAKTGIATFIVLIFFAHMQINNSQK